MNEVTVSGNTYEEALADGLEQLGVGQDVVEVLEMKDAHDETLPGAEPLPGVTLRLRVKQDILVSKAKEHLTKILELVGVDAKIEVLNRERGTILNILAGEDGSLIIGKNGQNIEALQYLINRMIVRSNRDLAPVMIDSEGYRQKHVSRLEELAQKTAARVRRTHRELALKPMPPADRKIVHFALKEMHGVHTISRGDEGKRYVVITPLSQDIGDISGQHVRRTADRRYGSAPPPRRTPHPEAGNEAAEPDDEINYNR